MVNQDKKFLFALMIAGIVGFAVLIIFVGFGGVRHVEIFWPEKVEQTVAFQDIDENVILTGISGTGEQNNPTLLTRVSFEYVLTVINQGDKHHRLYIDGINIQTDLLAPGEKDTIAFTPVEEGIYNYYDKRDRMELLGQIRVIAVSPDEDF